MTRTVKRTWNQWRKGGCLLSPGKEGVTQLSKYLLYLKNLYSPYFSFRSSLGTDCVPRHEKTDEYNPVFCSNAHCLLIIEGKHTLGGSSAASEALSRGDHFVPGAASLQFSSAEHLPLNMFTKPNISVTCFPDNTCFSFVALIHCYFLFIFVHYSMKACLLCHTISATRARHLVFAK